MQLPLIIDKKLTDEQLDVWHKVFGPSKNKNNDKTIEESLWRRTQSEKNKHQSGWENDNNKNRKIVYYRHEYDLINNRLALIDSYVYFCITMEESRYQNYLKMISDNLNKNWQKINKNQYKLNDLTAEFNIYKDPSERPHEIAEFPNNYSTLELKIFTTQKDDTEMQAKIWNISKAGMRKALSREDPTYIKDIGEISEFFPAQIELGCGPASEAGVLPLHTMHEIYSINEPYSKKFIMEAENDNFIDTLTANPLSAFLSTTDYYSRIITAKNTEFYSILKEFYDRELFVGPIITNNFDGIHLRHDIPEIFVRTYDEVVVMPELQFHPKAKSLFVIGCHADRRSIERRARERGLKIVYIDPEGWWVDGEFKSYPLESPQKCDYILKMPASEAFKKIKATKKELTTV